MEDIKITYRDVAFGLVIFNVVMGILFGSLPLIAGLMLTKKRIAWIGFAVAVIGGTMLGVIGAYAIAVIFLWLILRRRSETSGGDEKAPQNAEAPDA